MNVYRIVTQMVGAWVLAGIVGRWSARAWLRVWRSGRWDRLGCVLTGHAPARWMIPTGPPGFRYVCPDCGEEQPLFPRASTRVIERWASAGNGPPEFHVVSMVMRPLELTVTVEPNIDRLSALLRGALDNVEEATRILPDSLRQLYGAMYVSATLEVADESPNMSVDADPDVVDDDRSHRETAQVVSWDGAPDACWRCLFRDPVGDLGLCGPCLEDVRGGGAVAIDQTDRTRLDAAASVARERTGAPARVLRWRTPC